MTTCDSTQTAAGISTPKTASRVRLTALWFVVGALLQAALAISSALYGGNSEKGGFPYALHSPASLAWNSLATVSRGLLVAGVISLAVSGAGGQRRLTKIGVGIAVAGGAANALVAASVIVWLNLVSAADLHRTLVSYGGLDGLTSIVFSVGLILAAIAVLRERRWQGWQRFMPLLLGLYDLIAPSVAFPVSPTAGDVTLVIWTIPAALLALALRAEAGLTPRS